MCGAKSCTILLGTQCFAICTFEFHFIIITTNNGKEQYEYLKRYGFDIIYIAEMGMWDLVFENARYFRVNISGLNEADRMFAFGSMFAF